MFHDWVFACKCLDSFQRVDVLDTPENDSRPEECHEAACIITAPSVACLREILQGDQGDDSLPPALARDGQQLGKRGYVGYLVERK